MKPILALTLASFAAAGLSRPLPAQQASGAALGHVGFSARERAGSIPLHQIGATTEKQYSGDGLSVSATGAGARLRCVFQEMDGEVTREGLWLTSSISNAVGDRFRVMAASLKRTAGEPVFLSPTGKVEVKNELVRFIRPGVIEEFSVSMDGVRQDFIIERRPEGEGALRVNLAVTGARAEPLVHGARLVLDGSARKIAYGRLRVTDATGRELPARMELAENSEFRIRCCRE